MATEKLPLTAAHTQQLLIAKYLYAQAVKALDASVPMSAGFAVSLCQDAAELIIWTIARDVDAPSRDRAAFDAMWDHVANGRRNPNSQALPLRNLMNDVNKARVAFKHNGQLPTHSDAVRFMGYTDEFMNEAVQGFYGIALHDLSMASLIRDKKLFDEISALEKLLADGEYQECIYKSAVAAPHALALLNKIIPPVDSSLGNVGREFQYISGQLSLHRAVLGGLMLGLPHSDYMRFRMLVPGVSESPVTGSVQFQAPAMLMGYQYTEDDARFCIRYVTDIALHAESIVKPIEAVALARAQSIASKLNKPGAA